jgi:hypothetical protein
LLLRKEQALLLKKAHPVAIALIVLFCLGDADVEVVGLRSQLKLLELQTVEVLCNLEPVLFLGFLLLYSAALLEIEEVGQHGVVVAGEGTQFAREIGSNLVKVVPAIIKECLVLEGMLRGVGFEDMGEFATERIEFQHVFVVVFLFSVWRFLQLHFQFGNIVPCHFLFLVDILNFG